MPRQGNPQLGYEICPHTCGCIITQAAANRSHRKPQWMKRAPLTLKDGHHLTSHIRTTPIALHFSRSPAKICRNVSHHLERHLVSKDQSECMKVFTEGNSSFKDSVMDCISGPDFPSTIWRRSSNGLSQREKDVLSSLQISFGPGDPYPISCFILLGICHLLSISILRITKLRDFRIIHP